MTVSATYTPDQYTGTGANTALATTFVFDESSEIVVTSRVTATGVETTLTETTHYTVAGGSGSTGTVTPVDGATDFPVTVEWTLSRDTPITQETDWVENDDFPAESHEDAADKLTRIAQERDWNAVRALKFPTTDDTALDATLPSSVDRASLFLAFDADGEPIAAAGVTPATVTVSAYAETLLDDPDAATARATLDSQEDVITTRGDVVRGDASGDAERIALGAAGSVLTSDGSDADWAPLDYYNPNALINGSFVAWQRGTTFDATTTPANSDDTYLMDRWLLLSDGNDAVDVSQEATVIPTGSLYSVKFDVETINKQFGICQVIEQRNCIHLIGGTCSLSFKARTTSSLISNIRAVVLAWDGAADTVTSDVVSAWNGAGSDPTWAANWTYENTPSNLALTNAFQTFTIENISIDTSGATNIAVFIWVDDDDCALEDLLYIADVQLVPGASVGTCIHRDITEEIALCQRYFCKTFAYATAPATGAGYVGSVHGYGNSGGRYYLIWDFPVEMRTTPTITNYNPVSANSKAYNVTDTSDAEVVDLKGLGPGRVTFTQTDLSEIDDEVAVHATAEAEL